MFLISTYHNRATEGHIVSADFWRLLIIHCFSYQENGFSNAPLGCFSLFLQFPTVGTFALC